MKKQRLAEKIAEQLEQSIADGTLTPGDRLPAERALSLEMGVSRPSLREAIQKLISKGLLFTRPGGGTFVKNNIATNFNDPMVTMFRENPEYRFDVLEIRHALEGNAAYYAALRATDEDKEKIRKNYDKMIEVHGSKDPMDEARADSAFHLSIVEASHNLVLLHVMRGLFELLQNSISHNLDKLYTLPRTFGPLSTQHKALMEAVIEGRPEDAREAAQNHLAFVEDTIKEIDAEEARKIRSLKYVDMLNPDSTPS